MIYNRTYIDIINGKKIFTEKVQKFIELTEAEQSTLDRALFNLTAVNRITAKMGEIWDFIVGSGGAKVECQDLREWGEQEMFRKTNLTNLRENIYEILNEYQKLNLPSADVFLGNYQILNDEYIYTNLNNIEKMLYDVYLILKDKDDEWNWQDEELLYVVGGYSTVFSEGVLSIE